MIGPFTTKALADLLHAELQGPPDLRLDRIEPLERAGPGALSFVRSPEYARRWPQSRATAALVSRGIPVEGHDPASRAILIVPDADLAMVTLLEHVARLVAPPPLPQGVHPSAIVDPSAQRSPTASIGPLCTIGPGAHIAGGVVLHARVSVGRNVSIGRNSVIFPGAVLYDDTIIGENCIIHANAVIGADGFGYRPAHDGKGLVKIPHLGNVVVGNHCEIGAASCIDRAKFGSTTIGDGTKIDNLAQIGHGCTIGRAVVICGQVGLAGSVTIGDGAMIGGQAGVGDNLSVGPLAKVAAKTGIMENVPPGETWFGFPALPRFESLRAATELRRLAGSLREIRARLRTLEDARADTPNT